MLVYIQPQGRLPKSIGRGELEWPSGLEPDPDQSQGVDMRSLKTGWGCVGECVCVYECVCVESATFALSGFCGLGLEEDWGASEWPQAEAERDTLAG